MSHIILTKDGKRIRRQVDKSSAIPTIQYCRSRRLVCRLDPKEAYSRLKTRLVVYRIAM